MSRLEMTLITTLALGLLGLAAEDVAANTEAARRAAQHAERMIAGNDYQGAERSLAALDCGSDTGCQTLIDFSYGWLYESWADSDPMSERERLGRAQAYYSRAHKRSPSNIQILNNLALVSRRIGDAKTAVSAIESAIELDPDNAYERYLFLGDALSSQGEMDEARMAYRRAIKENAVQSEGHQRLLDSYRKTGGYRQLFDYGRRIWHQLPEVAVTGFEYSIRLGFLEDPGMAEEALPYWTAVRSDLGSLTKDTLNNLPGPAQWRFQ